VIAVDCDAVADGMPAIVGALLGELLGNDLQDYAVQAVKEREHLCTQSMRSDLLIACFF
jgi:hypothetical protein